MKNKIRALMILLIPFLLIGLLSYSMLAVKILLGMLIGGLVGGLYIFILEFINEMFPNDR